MTLSINILGPLAIKIDDRLIRKIPKKARALLAFLAAQRGEPVSRERLADLLWPYQRHDQSLHSLRNCLLELRKVLGSCAPVHLIADFQNCRVRDTMVDLDQFERLALSPEVFDLQTAADLYRGELLADFDITSEPFREWLMSERDRTLLMACAILERLTAALRAAGDHTGAMLSARRLVFLDPLSEVGQRALIRAYAHAGRRGEALRQYRSCAETLRRELSVAPDVETQALANEIRLSALTAAASTPPLIMSEVEFVRPSEALSNSPADALIPLGIELGNALERREKLPRRMLVEIVSHIKALELARSAATLKAA
jgi:DNA-binding SARP family transcriptional activator